MLRQFLSKRVLITMVVISMALSAFAIWHTSDSYADDIVPGSTATLASPHDIKWAIRMTGTTAKKVLYVDGTQFLSKEENISSQAANKNFTGNYVIGSSTTLSDTANTFPGTVDLFRIYNASLRDSEIESILNIDF